MKSFLKVLAAVIITAVGVGIYASNYTPQHKVKPTHVHSYVDRAECMEAWFAFKDSMTWVDVTEIGRPRYSDTYQYPVKVSYVYAGDRMVTGSCLQDGLIREYSYSEFVANMKRNQK